MQVRRAEGLGQAVHQVQPRRREQRAQPGREARVEVAPGVGQHPQARPAALAPIGGSEVVPQRRHAPELGDAVHRDGADDIARGEVIQQHRAGSRRPGLGQLVEPIVEAVRQDAEHAVVGSGVEELADRIRRVPQVRVAQHDALGRTGAARGVEQRCEVVGIALDIKWRAGRKRLPVVLQRQHRRPRRETHGPRSGGQQQLRARIRGDVVDLRCLELRVGGDEHRARPRRAEQGGDALDRLGQPGDDAVAGSDAPRRQPACNPPDQRVEFAIADATLAVDQSNAVGGWPLQQAVDPKWGWRLHGSTLLL